MLEIRIPDWLEFPSKEQALKYGEQAEVSVFLKAEAIFLLFDGSKEKILPQQTELYQFSYLKEKTYDRLGPPLSPEDIDHLVEVGELEQVLFSEKYILTEDDYQEFSGNLNLQSSPPLRGLILLPDTRAPETGVSVSGALVSGRRIKPRRGGLLWRLR